MKASLSVGSVSSVTSPVGGGQVRLWDPQEAAVRRRSAQLLADPKARELTHFIGSKVHEARLREAAGILPEEVKNIKDAARVILAASGEEDHVERFDPMGGCKARLEWRSEMDRSIRRLMQDADMMMDDRMHEPSKHGLRCEHLDKMYGWFERHGKKEAKKERPAPPFLSYGSNDPVMAGSMRRDTAQLAAQNQPRGWPSLLQQQKGQQVGPSIMAAAAHSMCGTRSSSLGGSPHRAGSEGSPVAFATPAGRSPRFNSTGGFGSTARSNGGSKWVPMGSAAA